MRRGARRATRARCDESACGGTEAPPQLRLGRKVALPSQAESPETGPRKPSARSLTGRTQSDGLGKVAVRNIALDLGTRKNFCSVAKDGTVVDRKTAGSLRGLRSVLGPDTPAARVAVEACREAWAVCDRLTEWGHEAVLVDTTRSRAMGMGGHGRKTDRIDADVLALALDANRIPRAHLLSPARRELRGTLAVRGSLVEIATKLINGIRGHARSAGEAIPKSGYGMLHKEGGSDEAIRSAQDPG